MITQNRQKSNAKIFFKEIKKINTFDTRLCRLVETIGLTLDTN